jgi:hypothetical protein
MGVMMANWIRKWSVTKEANGKQYVVSEADDGSWGCSCPVWTFKRQFCKHINLVRHPPQGGHPTGYLVEKILDKPKVDRPPSALEILKANAIYGGVA